jgi:hypothetical protein
VLVKQLREASGAGMMDCKKALAECGGDLEKAKDYLRKKGLASADKKAGRVAAEGMVWSYIHAGSRCARPGPARPGSARGARGGPGDCWVITGRSLGAVGEAGTGDAVAPWVVGVEVEGPP